MPILSTFKEAAKSAIRYAKAFANIPNVITATNFAKTFSKSDYSYSADAMKQFSGKALAELADPYVESLGLGEKLEKSPVAEGFNNFAASETRIDSTDRFATTKFNGETLAKRLTVTRDTPPEVAEAIKSVRGAVSFALELTEVITNPEEGAQAIFNKDIADLKECLLDPEFKYFPRSLTDYLFRIKDNAVDAIQEQHDAEKSNLEALFEEEDDDFRKNLQTSLGLEALEGTNLDNKLDAVKKNMLAELTASQTKELSAFEEGLNKPIKAMLASSKNRIAFLAMIDQNEQNRAAITSLIATSSGNLGVRAGSEAQERSRRYKNVDVKDLKTIMTATGRTITAQGENTYTLELPNRIFSPLFYRSSKNNLERSITELVLAIKARDFDTIEININHPDKEYAKKLARVAMEVCLKSGFQPKDIKIRVGEDLYAEEKAGDGNIKRKLFSDCGSRYDLALEEGKENAKEWEKALEESETEDPGNFKERVTKVVADAKAAARQPAEEEAEDDHLRADI